MSGLQCRAASGNRAAPRLTRKWAGESGRKLAFGDQADREGAMSGALKNKLGLTIETRKVEDRGRIYRIAG